MAHMETGNTAEASSEPISSENKIPKSLKPKPKISKKPLNNNLIKLNKLKGTLKVQGAKSKKKMSALGGKNISSNNEKQDAENLNTRELKRKNIVNAEHDEKNQENMKIKEKRGRLQKGMKQKNSVNVEHNEKNQENMKIKVKRGRLQKRQHNENNQEQWNENMKIKEKHGRLQKRQYNEKNQEQCNELEKNERGKMNKEKHGQLESEQIEKKKEKLGGLIFMCSAKTKPDCFHYRVMGVPMSKKDLVLGVKPGLKLFLYDFDLKLMYGIYRASSSGGMKLEPAAFDGGFPVQVRFNVHQDCYPLPESVFRRAIKENYNERNKFNTELTVQQVKKLIELFRPAEVQSLAPPICAPPVVTIHNREVDKGVRESWTSQQREFLSREPHTYDGGRRYHVLSNENNQLLTYREGPSKKKEDFSQDYFLSEKEYRTYGLLREKQILTPPRSHIAPTLEPHSGGHLREQLLMHPGTIYRDAAPAQGQAANHDPHLEAEKQYKTYDLFPRQVLQSSTPLATTTTASIVDSYLKVPYYVNQYGSAFPDPYRPSSRREEVRLGSAAFNGRGEACPSGTEHLQQREIYPTRTENSWRGESYLTETNYLGRRENVDAGMLYSTYASNALSEYNQIRNYQGATTETSVAPVSSRYSFAGPSLFHP